MGDSEPPSAHGPVTEQEELRLWLAYLTPAKPPSQLALAREFGRNRETIARHLSGPAFEKFRDEQLEIIRQRATQKLARGAEQAADDWLDASGYAAERGDHRPAKELLQAVGIVQRDGPTGNLAVQIVVGAPGSPALPDPFAGDNAENA